MVYTISENVDKITELGQIMDAKFHRVKNTDDEFDELNSTEKRRVWKNVLLIGFAFMLLFTAFWGASNLQSSVNSEAALGTFTLASIYGSLLVSNIFLPSLVIKWLGAKWAVVLSFILYMPFILSQFYPHFYTLIPAGLAVGLGGGPLWCAKCTYLTVISEAYAILVNVPTEVIVTRFFGIFFMFYSFSQVWGNLISSAVLSSDVENTTNRTSLAVDVFLNKTVNIKDDQLNKCGANFCPGFTASDSNPNLTPPSQSKINIITMIYFFCMVAGVLIISFGVDKMSRYKKGKKSTTVVVPSGWALLTVTLKHARNPIQILILPITMLIGAEQAFLAAEYTSAYVSCGWGISNIGFVMICFGACNGLASIFIGNLVKITGRGPVIAFGFILHMALLITLLVWRPNPNSSWVFFVVSGLWGVCDALWLVQINSYSGILFPDNKEAAFSNFRLWESTGSVITYICSPYLCVHTKIYLLMGLLIIGIIGYVAAEYLKSKRKNYDGNEGSQSGKFELADNNIKSGEVAE